jgi:hypothetical protein
MFRMLSGDLQQQSTDADGLYTWAKRHFSIDPSGKMLSVQDIDSTNSRSEVVQMDLTGLKFAKEWTTVMNQTEVGFDVIWDSGTIWSFLAESEAVCRTWVDSFNNAAASSAGDAHIQFSHKLPVTPARHQPVDLMSPTNKTTVGLFDADGHDTSNITFNYSRGGLGARDNAGAVNMSSAAQGMKVHMTNAAGANISPITLVRSGGSSDKSSSNESSPGSDILVLGGNKENVQANLNMPKPPQTTDNRTGQGFEPPSTPAVPRGSQLELEQRYQQLQHALQKERLEANIAREQLSRVRDEVDLRTTTMEKELQRTREVEFKKSQEVRDEVQRRFLETANDTLECHQSNLSALQEQHRREVKVLQEDMAALRER